MVRWHVQLIFVITTMLPAACRTAGDESDVAEFKRSDTACINSLAATIQCPEGQALTHVGCAGPTHMVHCAHPVPPAVDSCINSLTATIQCESGSALTHAGCQGPSYMKRCAPCLNLLAATCGGGQVATPVPECGGTNIGDCHFP